jgi:hypothetical protein
VGVRFYGLASVRDQDDVREDHLGGLCTPLAHQTCCVLHLAGRDGMPHLSQLSQLAHQGYCPLHLAARAAHVDFVAAGPNTSADLTFYQTQVLVAGSSYRDGLVTVGEYNLSF